MMLREVRNAIREAERLAQWHRDPDHPEVIAANQRAEAAINQLPAWQRPLWRAEPEMRATRARRRRLWLLPLVTAGLWWLRLAALGGTLVLAVFAADVLDDRPPAVNLALAAGAAGCGLLGMWLWRPALACLSRLVADQAGRWRWTGEARTARGCPRWWRRLMAVPMQLVGGDPAPRLLWQMRQPLDGVETIPAEQVQPGQVIVAVGDETPRRRWPAVVDVEHDPDSTENLTGEPPTVYLLLNDGHRRRGFYGCYPSEPVTVLTHQRRDPGPLRPAYPNPDHHLGG